MKTKLIHDRTGELFVNVFIDDGGRLTVVIGSARTPDLLGAEERQAQARAKGGKRRGDNAREQLDGIRRRLGPDVARYLVRDPSRSASSIFDALKGRGIISDGEPARQFLRVIRDIKAGRK